MRKEAWEKKPGSFCNASWGGLSNKKADFPTTKKNVKKELIDHHPQKTKTNINQGTDELIGRGCGTEGGEKRSDLQPPKEHIAWDREKDRKSRQGDQ